MKRKRQIIGFTAGVFDLFHIGHLNIFRNAKGLCDKLIVAVTTDELARERKNKIPVIPYEERAEIVRNVKQVDVAVPQDSMDKYDLWKRYKFDIMFVGDDWYETEKWNEIEVKLRKEGVKIIYFPYTKGTSSTLINQILEEKRKDKLK
jgi:glycerol-3-phosphate cytidylyltransferase